MSRPAHRSLLRRVYVWRTPKEAYNPECMPGSNSETRVRFCDGLGTNIAVQYSVGPIITLHGRINAREYVDRLGNQGHPTVQTLFPNNDGVSQEDNASIHTAGTVQSWFDEHEGELQHLPWPAQSPDLKNIEPLRSIWRLDCGRRSHI
jgi:hypothetical protein